MVSLTVRFKGAEEQAGEFAKQLVAHIGKHPVIDGTAHKFTFGKQEEIDHVKKLLPQVMDNVAFDEPEPEPAPEPEPDKP